MPDSRVTLFRAVSLAEYNDLLAHRRFRVVVGSLEGKWFATTKSDAEAWGRGFERFSGPSKVIKVGFPSSQIATFDRLERLDGIGPAWFAEIDQLADVVIDVEDLEA